MSCVSCSNENWNYGSMSCGWRNYDSMSCGCLTLSLTSLSDYWNCESWIPSYCCSNGWTSYDCCCCAKNSNGNLTAGCPMSCWNYASLKLNCWNCYDCYSNVTMSCDCSIPKSCCCYGTNLNVSYSNGWNSNGWTRLSLRNCYGSMMNENLNCGCYCYDSTIPNCWTSYDWMSYGSNLNDYYWNVNWIPSCCSNCDCCSNGMSCYANCLNGLMTPNCCLNYDCCSNGSNSNDWSCCATKKSSCWNLSDSKSYGYSIPNCWTKNGSMKNVTTTNGSNCCAMSLSGNSIVEFPNYWTSCDLMKSSLKNCCGLTTNGWSLNANCLSDSTIPNCCCSNAKNLNGSTMNVSYSNGWN